MKLSVKTGDNTSGTSEKELALRAQKKDAEAERQLFACFRPEIEAYVAGQSGPVPGAERQDLVQEGMIGLLEAVHDYDPDRNPNFHAFAWLCIRRQILNAREKLSRQKNQPLNSYVSLEADTKDTETPLENVLGKGDLNPEVLLLQDENADALRERLNRDLTPLERQVLFLYLEGYRGKNLAMILNRSPKSVDNALQRVRKKLQS